MPEKNMIRWEQGSDGVVVLTMDDPDQPVNTMNRTYIDAMEAAVVRLEAERENVTGVVLTSAKKSFFAGGDIGFMSRARPEDAAELSEVCTVLKSQLRRLETFGRPVAAALNGTALGGGYEIALACHRRIALDAPGSRIGLPEVTLGLLPGCGGVSRTVRLLGLERALADVLLRGQRYRPADALAKGLVHELARTPGEMLARAREWVLAHPGAAQPWDRPGYRIPGGAPSHPRVAAALPAYAARLRRELRGADLPAPRNILAAAVESAQTGFETGQGIETSYLVELMTGQVAKNMMGAHSDLRHIRSGGSRPAGHPPHAARKAAVLGAGMMGAGIAYSCARGGLRVVLKDVSYEAAQRGKEYAGRLLATAVARGRMSREDADGALARITPTADPADLAGCDLVIEAVFEDPALKRRVFREIEDIVAPDAVLATNTSTLPVTGLAEGVGRPEDFIGLHFFSPVDRMPLLEIVTGEKTGDRTLAKAVDIARQIGKTPIVVDDGRGFFTSRVIAVFLDEAVAMVGEGLPPASVEQAGAQAGYPVPPLRLLDELTLTLPRTIREETKAAVLAGGGRWRPHGSEAVVDRMIDEFGRRGRSSGAGFYAYAEDGGRTGLWPGLYEHFTVAGRRIPFADMKERMLFAEALEAVRCLDDGVLRSVSDANAGSLLGIGFPAWTGGVLRYVDGYAGGPSGFVARARELADRYGERFEPPASLVARAARGERYS
ncbi:3-hydroxyacyl-CoA dehydrogenase NAD-binding domain-containing protein [Streptomyces sp. NPDC093546]|uniref:3-hydroxyacyl-CoA dehydrogenase NAD-binding domain-containing protein n=1 Tax=Streptomyces sp. NPDC093546 TaxID=3366040 RepID=UPI003817DEFE